MKTSCKIIGDLLPLYHDEVCSAESRKLVGEHLQECEACKAMLARLDNEILFIKPPQDDILAIKKISFAWRRARIKSLIKGFLIAFGICISFFAVYLGLTELRIFPVESNVTKISDACMLENGLLAFRLAVTDNYEVPASKQYTDSNRITYLTPLRAFIKPKKDNTRENWYNGGYNISQLDGMDSFYVGSPKDAILVWKKGMVLPSANKDTEEKIKQMFISEK